MHDDENRTFYHTMKAKLEKFKFRRFFVLFLTPSVLFTANVAGNLWQAFIFLFEILRFWSRGSHRDGTRHPILKKKNCKIFCRAGLSDELFFFSKFLSFSEFCKK